MEELKNKKEKLETAYDKCMRAFHLYEHPRLGITDPEREAIVLWVLRNFELLCNALWTYSQLFFEQKYGEGSSEPKNIVRDYLDQELIAKNELVVWLNMIDSLNVLYFYEFEFAKELCAQRSKEVKFVEELIKKIV